MEMATKPKVEEILGSIHYETCTKAVDIAINTMYTPTMVEVTKEEEIRGVTFTVKKFFQLDEVTLYISKNPRLTVLVVWDSCYYVDE